MQLQEILNELPRNQEKLAEVRDMIIANAIMIAEIAAPTGEENERVRFVNHRFRELGLQSVSEDEAGNAQAILPGNGGSDHILVSAHADTLAVGDPQVAVSSAHISGAGIADNSLGLAVVMSLPEILGALGITLHQNLILLGAASSLGEGDLKGLRFFLDHINRPIRAGICVEGVYLGRLSYSCLGMVRGEIICQTPPASSDWTDWSHQNAIVTLNEIVRRILEIPLPQKPKTRVILGSMNAGRGYNRPPGKARLRFEIRSEQVGKAREIRKRIAEIVDEISAETGTEIVLNLLARRKPGGVSFGHPMVKAIREIMHTLAIQPKFAPSTGDLSALISKGIPGITLGITRGEHFHEPNESVEIEPILPGVAQLVALLRFLDSHSMKPDDAAQGKAGAVA